MNDFVDLHIHTIFSDGDHTPNEIIKMAQKLGAKYISFTDHDSISAYQNIKNLTDLNIITGCEFTTKFNGTSIHVLGYGFDIENPELKQYFADLRKTKVERLSIYKKVLEENNLFIPNEFYKNTIEKNLGISATGIVFYLKENNYNFDADSIYGAMRQAARSVGKPFKTAEEIIELIHKLGGKAVLAHPMEYKLNDDELNSFIAKLKTAGLDGLESYNSKVTPQESSFLRKIAEKNKLLISGGSDFHSQKLKTRKLVCFKFGLPLTQKEISAEFLESKNLFRKNIEFIK